MPGGFAPRFALEAGFLLLLAVGAGLADLRPAAIVAAMAAAWALVSLLEWAIWRVQAAPAAPPFPPSPRPEPEPTARAEVEPEAEGLAPPLEAGGYPLRPDAGAEHAEEVEAYTRVVEPEEPAADNGAEAAQAHEPSGVAAKGEEDRRGERAE